ncbi:MAG: hypothetical protein K0R17_1929 [Rariglobus sp.]|jgi:hypothetical protein|nr:hypothetical protein [Rariglobus sp.]
MKDPRDPLSSTLQTWRHEPAPAPDFNQGVWARIHSTGATREPAALFHFPGAIPLAASLAILFALAAGSGGAFALNRSLTTDRMADAYVRSIDPVRMTASGPTHVHP